MSRLAALVLGLAVIAGGGIYFLTRADPITEFLNNRWPPVNIEQQREKAVVAAANALEQLSNPNVAAGIDTNTLERLAEPLLKPLGITKLRIISDRQLLRVEADFDRRFKGDDVPEESGYRGLAESLKPDIAGTLVISVGIASGSPDPQTADLRLRLLPAFNSLRVSKVELANKANVTTVGEALATLLTRYANNVTGALDSLPVLDVVFPTSPLEPFDPTGPIKVNIPGAPDVKVTLSSKPIIFPFRLAALAWLIDDNRITAIGRYAPKAETTTVAPTFTATFDDLRRGFLNRLREGMEIVESPGSAWAAIGKDLIATALNSTFDQALPCLSATGTIPQQSFKKKVEIPDETTMDCTPTKDCTSTRDCTSSRDCTPTEDCSQHEDCSQTEDCSACLFRNPLNNKCVTRGNDPLCEARKVTRKGECEARKVARRGDCEARKTARKLDCERLKSQVKLQCETEKAGEKLACEIEKTGKKAICETAKEGLKRLSRTGNLANLEGSVRGNANLKMCVSAASFAQDLSSASFALRVSGNADLDTHLKFIPLDIVGYLSCPLGEWTEDRTFKASMPEQTLPIKMGLSRKYVEGRQAYDAHVDEFTIKYRIEPGPTAVFLQSRNFNITCFPAAGLINAVTLNLAPLIPELLTEFEHKQKAMDFFFQPGLPSLMVGKTQVKTEAAETGLAILLRGSM